MSGYWATLFSLVGVALLLSGLFSDSRPTLDPDNILTHQVDKIVNPTANNIVQESRKGLGSEAKDEVGSVRLEDYEPMDPTPSSKTAVKPGPIPHGAPLIPFLPNPSPSPAPPAGSPGHHV